MDGCQCVKGGRSRNVSGVSGIWESRGRGKGGEEAVKTGEIGGICAGQINRVGQEGGLRRQRPLGLEAEGRGGVCLMSPHLPTKVQ